MTHVCTIACLNVNGDLGKFLYHNKTNMIYRVWAVVEFSHVTLLPQCLEHCFKSNLRNDHKYYSHSLCDISLPDRYYVLAIHINLHFIKFVPHRDHYVTQNDQSVAISFKHSVDDANVFFKNPDIQIEQLFQLDKSEAVYCKHTVR